MIVTEKININSKAFIRSISDKGAKLERDGALYDEAIDPAEFGRTYTETNENAGSLGAETIRTQE